MPATLCLDESTASKLVLGLLPSEVATESEQHLLECQTCLKVVDAIVPSDELIASLRDSEQAGDLSNNTELDAEVDLWWEDLDRLAGTAQSTTSAFAEIRGMLEPTDSEDDLGRFSHLRVVEILGAGGMGIVLKAVDERIGRSVALKLMRPSLAANDNAKLRFRREAMAVAAFEHNQIVTVYDVDEHNGTPFFTMELLEGESLRDRLAKREKLPVLESLRIAREIAMGLASAHGRGQLHRDIKPDNVWLRSPDDQVKILDFGLVHSVDSKATLTHSGTILGTPEYMSPEQACGDEVDQRCDLFSLGCVLYHMLTGRPPFHGKNVVATLVAISNAVIEPPSKLDSQVPEPVSDLVVRLLKRDADQRSNRPRPDCRS